MATAADMRGCGAQNAVSNPHATNTAHNHG